MMMVTVDNKIESFKCLIYIAKRTYSSFSVNRNFPEQVPYKVHALIRFECLQNVSTQSQHRLMFHLLSSTSESAKTNVWTKKFLAPHFFFSNSLVATRMTLIIWKAKTKLQNKSTSNEKRLLFTSLFLCYVSSLHCFSVRSLGRPITVQVAV